MDITDKLIEEIAVGIKEICQENLVMEGYQGEDSWICVKDEELINFVKEKVITENNKTKCLCGSEDTEMYSLCDDCAVEHTLKDKY